MNTFGWSATLSKDDGAIVLFTQNKENIVLIEIKPMFCSSQAGMDYLQNMQQCWGHLTPRCANIHLCKSVLGEG